VQFCPALLNKLANQILAQYSFQFDSFTVARTTIFTMAKPSIEYTFDRLSLIVFMVPVHSKPLHFSYKGFRCVYQIRVSSCLKSAAICKS